MNNERESREKATVSQVLQVISEALNDDHGTTLLIVCHAGKESDANVIHTQLKEECKDYILQVLHDAGGSMPLNILDATTRAAGYDFSIIRKARRELKQQGLVKNFSTGCERDGNRVWHLKALPEPPEA